MPGFFFRPVDLSSLALFFVAALVGWRLWTLRLRTSAGRWLTLFFVASALFALASMVASARLDNWQFYAVHMQVAFSALGVAALLQYVYRVGDVDLDDIEARGAWYLSLAALVYVFGWAIYQFGQLNPAGNPSTSTAISEGLTALGLLWTLVVAIRQARQSGQAPARPRGRLHMVMLTGGVALMLFASGFQFIGGLIEGFVPRTVYTVYIVALAVIVIGFNYFLEWDQANSRVNRVIAAALVLLQSVFAVLAVLYGAQLASEAAPVNVLGERTLHLSPGAEGGYLVEESDEPLPAISGEPVPGDHFLVPLDFPLLFFGERYEVLLVRPGRVLFGEDWSAQKANYYLQPHIFVANLTGSYQQELQAEVAQSADQVRVGWMLPDGGRVQLTIRRDGVLVLSYAGMTEQPLHSWGLSAGEGLEGVKFLLAFPPSAPGEIPAAGILFDRAFNERIRQDGWTRPILYFQVAVSVLAAAILLAVRGRLDTLDQVLMAEALTGRQLEIAALVAEGRSNAEIGRALSITEATVKYHLTRIYQLVQVDDRQTLAVWYLRARNLHD